MVDMKISLSKQTVHRLTLMLVDFYQMDLSHQDKIWGDFDCLGIIDDLMSADANRDESGLIDVGEETILWLSVILENMLDASDISVMHKVTSV